MLPFLRRALHAPLSRKLLFARVSLLLLAIEAALRLFPFVRVYRFVRRFHPDQTGASQREADGAEICWAVNRSGRFWFHGEGCLPQALLGEALLLRRGIPAQMSIGVRRLPDGSTLAHAWVESGGQVVIGSSDGSMPSFQHFPGLRDVAR